MGKIRPEFSSPAELDAYLSTGQPLLGCVFQGLDLRGHTANLIKESLADTLFLGCELESEALTHAQASGAVLLPTIEGLPYESYRGLLYTVEELFDQYEPGVADSYHQTLDARVYEHYVRTGKEDAADIKETLARRLHDHAISDALAEVLSGQKVVAIMGGHSMKRSDPSYLSIAGITRELTQKGFLTVSGGGPGAMEATHLGAWFADREADDLADAVRLLSKAPSYEPIGAWLDAAFEVRVRYPPLESTPERISVGIPTWLYGHEPPNVFATYIAKYFANSVREEGLLAVAGNGVIFAPGSAGTIQEVFQDAAQNHYLSFGGPSPMVFFGEDYWKCSKPVYPLLAQLAAGRAYAKHLWIGDDPEEVIRNIENYATENR